MTDRLSQKLTQYEYQHQYYLKNKPRIMENRRRRRAEKDLAEYAKSPSAVKAVRIYSGMLGVKPEDIDLTVAQIAKEVEKMTL